MIWARYVPHALVADYEAKGWRRTDGLAGTSHGHWSVLMIREDAMSDDIDLSRFGLAVTVITGCLALGAVIALAIAISKVVT